MLFGEINVAVDSGKGFSKFLVRDINTREHKHSVFPTKVQKASNNGWDLSSNSFTVEYRKETYMIGDAITDNLVNADLTKTTKEHLLCIYLSIANAIKVSNIKKAGIYNVNLAVNTPLTIFKNKKLKQEYEDYIRQEGKVIQLTVNGELYHFKIKNIFPLQEGLGSLFIRQNDFRDKNVIQIDIGTLNVSVSSFNNLIPNFDSNFSNNFGTNSLYSKLRERLSTDYGVTIHYKDIEQIVKDRVLVVAGEKMADSTVVIKELMKNHAQQISASLKSEVSLNNTEIVFIGGGSLLLKEQLQELFPFATFEPDPQFSTLKTFYQIMETKLRVKAS